jgi:hypothetical protein
MQSNTNNTMDASHWPSSCIYWNAGKIVEECELMEVSWMESKEQTLLWVRVLLLPELEKEMKE